MDGTPLTPEDCAILALESATVAGHTCKVVRLGAGAPDLAAIRARVTERLPLVPALGCRLAGAPDAPVWRRAEPLDPAAHVVAGPVAEPVGRGGLCEVVARLFERRLDHERPLWQMHHVPLEDGGAALVWRIHHALADGTAAIRFARLLLWDHGDEGAPTRARARAEHRADEARRRAHLAGLLRREFARAECPSPFDGRIGADREVAFAAFPLAPLHDAARTVAGATLNDAVLAMVGGALRRWLEVHHGELGALRVRVPVSLHEAGDDAGNRDSFFSVGLPLQEPDPVRRLRDVHAATAERKADGDAGRLDALRRELDAASPLLERIVGRIEDDPRRFALSVSNVPGPREPVAVLGTPVTALHTLAEIGERHALRVAVVSLAGRLYFGFCVDPGIVRDADLLAAGVEAEGAALVASTAAGSVTAR